MNNYKAGLVSGVVALVVLVGGLYLAPKTQVVNNSVIEKIEKTVEKVIQEKLGAIPGVEVSGNYFIVGGVTKYSASQSIAPGTSTACALLKPLNATSTLDGATFVWNATNTASGVDLARNTASSTAAQGLIIAFSKVTEDTSTSTAFATTTLISDTYTTGASRTHVLTASSTLVAGSSADAGAEDGTEIWDSLYQYLVVKAINGGAGNYGNYFPSGHCTATWTIIDR